MTQTAAAALALFAMLFTGLVPSGWMPLVRAGSVEIVICTGAGFVTKTVDVGGSDGPAPLDQHGEANGTCQFAGLGQPAPMPADVSSLAIAWFLDGQPGPLIVHSAAFQTAHRRLPPSQGPPLSI